MKDGFFDECMENVDKICGLITDENYEEISKDLTDGVGSILANAAISVLEQRKLLQSSKSPSALIEAIKAIAITSGNLINAGTGILSWMGKKLPKRDSVENEKVMDSAIEWAIGRSPRLDSLDNMEAIISIKDSKNTYTILRRDSDNFALVHNYNESTGLFDSIQYGFNSVDSAVKTLYSEMLNLNVR